MDSILSIQSHVVYGYVGNKAAVYPLQAMGFDVWPINTVQFSNHTGYGKCNGEIFDAAHILQLVDGIFSIGQAHKCKAILTGYMGSGEICRAVSEIVKRFKELNHELVYLCDPVIGNNSCYVKPEVLSYFKNNLSADIITPNQYEAEILSGIKINAEKDLTLVANYFHDIGVKIVVITGIKLAQQLGLKVFVSNLKDNFLIDVKEYEFSTPIHGTGDLFASTFLGAYLKSKQIEYAARYATLCLQLALEKTRLTAGHELQVLSVKYHDVDIATLPKHRKPHK